MIWRDLPEAAVKVASFFSVLNKKQVDSPAEAGLR
jgi:hypothetical protein